MTGIRRAARRARWRDNLAFYGFISPWIIGTAVLTLFPLGYAAYVSMTSWDGISPFKAWVGFANYAEVLTSPDTWSALLRTLLLVAIVVPATIGGSLFLAMWLNDKVKGRIVFRTIIYLPAVVPIVASALIWKVIFDKDTGSANRILATFGINPVSWLTGNAAFVSLIVVMLWGIGAGIIIYLAALQTVDPEQLEAAKMDGAGSLITFRHVTLPAISPVVLFQTVVTLIATLQVFIPALLLAPTTGGNSSINNVPAANHLYMVDVWSQFFQFSRYGYGSAMIIVFVVVILVITAIVFRVGGRNVYYAVDPDDDGALR
jgi:multiple sugar transport system permease protein